MTTAPRNSSAIAAALRRDGFCIVRRAVSPALVAKVDRALARDFEATAFSRGPFYGERTKRFGGLLARSRHCARLVLQDVILAAVEELLLPWCDSVQLNLTQAVALHPGALAQAPHRDQDMWRGTIGEVEYLVNVMWPFTRYDADNGATLVWPESHGAAALAAEPAGDPLVATMEPGDALVFLGSALHGGGANRSDAVRRGAIISYCLGWLKPYENQWLVYPPDVARDFSPELAALVGYRQHRPNLGNVEGRCPSLLLQERMEWAGAEDALRPDQAEMVAAHAAEQRAAQR
ncbi:phytanoyl-CoA dioxygenase family protein [Allosphingosinicella indica]|uniref:Ectoine hydroxylase-related dioxygenase, phytanoyl-CoA dioxygenase (PhyH) family n=1 Tax=Allosphingosinicella indica TaxID=941907 RepID=A0A1X7FYK2_9SPHN|nr:phytanoyl-CoA dioxygenase family protein [Allosphingosinicella indica]SMF61048.1 Ectoine hydroxylase-related dioxygenase, phytanoyl-CoA dioxygenase (PhyH) family [Allosphingosinicella indica]